MLFKKLLPEITVVQTNNHIKIFFIVLCSVINKKTVIFSFLI